MSIDYFAIISLSSPHPNFVTTKLKLHKIYQISMELIVILLNSLNLCHLIIKQEDKTTIS